MEVGQWVGWKCPCELEGEGSLWSFGASFERGLLAGCVEELCWLGEGAEWCWAGCSCNGPHCQWGPSQEQPAQPHSLSWLPGHWYSTLRTANSFCNYLWRLSFLSGHPHDCDFYWTRLRDHLKAQEPSAGVLDSLIIRVWHFEPTIWNPSKYSNFLRFFIWSIHKLSAIIFKIITKKGLKCATLHVMSLYNILVSPFKLITEIIWFSNFRGSPVEPSLVLPDHRTSFNLYWSEMKIEVGGRCQAM